MQQEQLQSQIFSKLDQGKVDVVITNPNIMCAIW